MPKKSHLAPLAALAATLVFTTACFVGPACGCGGSETPSIDTDESWPTLGGAADEDLAACVARSWDVAVPMDNAAYLTVEPEVAFADAGRIAVTLEVGDDLTTFEWEEGEEIPWIHVSVQPGEAIAVHFASDVPAVLDWTFSVGGVTSAEEVVVSEFEDPEAPLPESCL